MIGKEASVMRKMLFACDCTERFIWLDLPGKLTITAAIAERFCRALARLNQQGAGPVFVYLSGRGGGDFYACLKMIHAIEASNAPVFVVAFGVLRSGTFLITQAARACYAVADTRLQFHHATDFYMKGRSDAWGMSQTGYWRKMELLRLIDATQVFIFTRRGRPVSSVFRAFEREEKLTVRRALALHLVDSTYCRKEFVHMRALARAHATKKQ